MTHSADSSAMVRLLRFVDRRLDFLLNWNLKKKETIETVPLIFALDQTSSLFL